MQVKGSKKRIDCQGSNGRSGLSKGRWPKKQFMKPDPCSWDLGQRLGWVDLTGVELNFNAWERAPNKRYLSKARWWKRIHIAGPMWLGKRFWLRLSWIEWWYIRKSLSRCTNSCPTHTQLKKTKKKELKKGGETIENEICTTFSATIWYLSNASLVTKGSEILIPRRSEATVEGNDCEAVTNSLQ